ncbi:MAG: hypothetical protein ACRC0A_04765 [Chitinophagaceae bacterium]
MKKIILSIVGFGLIMAIHAQNFYKVEDALNNKKYAEALLRYQVLKSKDTKNKMQTNPDAYYWLGMIYQKLSDTLSLASEIAEVKDLNLVLESLNQFRTCLIINPKYPALKLVQGQPLYNMYAKSFQNGIDQYNEKNLDKAIQYLVLADSVSKFIFNNKFGLSALDTQLCYYTGLAHVNAITQKDSLKAAYHKIEAEKYFAILANAKVKQGMKDVSKWVLSVAISDKNEDWFNRYLSFVKEMYPEDNNVWDEFETEFSIKSAGNDKMKVIETYKTLQQKNPNDYTFFYNEAVEIFDFLVQNMDKFDEFLPEMQRAANESFKLKSDAYQPLFLIQKIYMGKIDSYGDSIRRIQKMQREITAKYAKAAKGSSQEKEKNKQLISGKAQIAKYEALQKKYAQEALPISLQLDKYFESKINSLQNKDKALYRETLDNLGSFYELLKDIDNADKYSQKSNKIK